MTEIFAVGDLVEAVKGEERHTERLLASKVKTFGITGRPYMEDFKRGVFIDTLEADGWTFTVIEKALPPLPTEPGIYAEANHPVNRVNLWQLSESGNWFSLAGPKYDHRAAEFAPFTRLAPVAEVLTMFAAKAHWGIDADSIQKTAAHYGVTL